MSNPILDAARAKREATQTKLDELLEDPTEEKRELTDEEATEFEELAKKLRKLDKQIEGLEAEEARAAQAAAAAAEILDASPAVVTRETMTYDKWSGNSYIRDMSIIAASAIDTSYQNAVPDARARLLQHGKEVEIEARKNERLAGMLTELRMTPRSLRPSGDFEQRVNPNTTDGTGGEFVPPTWWVDRYVPFARAGRVIANRMPTEALPPGTDSINLPKILTGTAAAIQAAQANAVQSTDLTTSTVTAAVNTIAGQQDISVQLLEQSPINMDGVIFDDLSADYDMKLDRQVISGTGANGQHLGIFSQTAASANSTTAFNTDASKMNAVTCASILFWDGTTATSFTQYRSIINAMTNIDILRFAPPTAIYVHPRRANHWQLASDSTIGRPLYTSYGRFNALGGPGFEVSEGETGEVAGLPVIKDANIPIVCVTGALTGGSGDMIGVLRESDMRLWEGSMRMRVLPEVLSGTLQVRLQIYAYSAFMPHRYPASTTLVTGTTGLAAPSW